VDLLLVSIGNDHFITNTIVFSSKIGVAVTGAANLLTGVHTWCVLQLYFAVGMSMNTQSQVVS
jgi:hypothetical protein